MSPENQSVFKLLKEVTFLRILAFFNSRKWGYFGVISRGSFALVGWWSKSLTQPVAFVINRANDECEISPVDHTLNYRISLD